MTTVLHHHLGLGDHIICNGLVRTLAKDMPLSLVCKHHNFHNIKLMYSNNTNINIVSVYNDEEARILGSNHNYIRLGVGLNPNFIPGMEQSWDKVFYDQANINFENSWKFFDYVKPETQNPVPQESYVLLCNKGSDNIDRIDYRFVDIKLLKIYSDKGNFFENVDLIQNASEIHCINSSFIHFIDRIDISEKIKLFYHKNFKYKNHSNFTLKKKWILV